MGADGIEVDVIADGAQVAVAAAVHDEGFVATAEEMPEELVAAVESRGVGAQEPFHSRDKIGQRRFDEEMEVIGHQTKRMHLPFGFGARFAEGAKEQLTVRISLENRLAPIAAIHDVIDSAFVFEGEAVAACDENKIHVLPF